MLIPTSGVFDLSLRHIFKRGHTYYYQRRIPKDLVDRYGGPVNVKVKLKTADPLKLAKQVTSLNKKYEATWSSLRNNLGVAPISIRQSAIKLLREYDLKPLPAENDWINVDGFVERIRHKHEEFARNEGLDLDEVQAGIGIDAVEAEALRLINEKPRFRLSDALRVYINGHQKKNDKSFVEYTTRVWGQLMEFLGDREFDEVTRADANAFVVHGLNKGSKTTTVSRQVSTIKAVFNVAIIEKELAKTNPFLRLRIAGLGEDAVSRGTLDSTQLNTLYAECRREDDDIRWLIALQIDLGCRLGEAVGLSLSDFHMSDVAPYLSIRPHSWRSLKTKSSKRDVPLTGASLWAARRIVESAHKGQIYAFPRYTSAEECKAAHASNTANDWIRSLGIDRTTHSLRHSLRDRLRNCGAPKSIQDAVGGWSREDVGDKYGLGYELVQLKTWLDKVALAIEDTI